MEQFKDDLLILIDGDKEYRKKILFTCEHDDKKIVFFTDEGDDPQDAQCAYYDDQGNIDPLTEDDYKWAEKEFNRWQLDKETKNEEEKD